MLRKLGLEDGEAIIHPWINKALEKAQQKVEARNFDIRKNLLKFDDVMNDQRKVVYAQRRDIMSAEDVHETIIDMRHDVIEGMVARAIPEKALPDQWDVAALHEESLRVIGIDFPVVEWAAEEGIADEAIQERILERVDRLMAEKAANWGPEMMRFAEKSVLLQLLDQIWKEHLLSLDHLRQGIGLRAYAQKDPLNEYKSEAFEVFDEMLTRLRESVTGALCHLQIQAETPEGLLPGQAGGITSETHEDPAMALAGANGGEAEQRRPMQRMVRRSGSVVDPLDPSTWGKVPRNAPCPCGSGKKYKQCHGRLN
jgi:preprotein translocase subunit SecA